MARKRIVNTYATDKAKFPIGSIVFVSYENAHGVVVDIEDTGAAANIIVRLDKDLEDLVCFASMLTLVA